MSLDKAIAHGKEKRKPYYGSKAIDPTCRNHGGCPWCEENRKHKFRDKHPQEEETMEDYISLDDAREAMWRVLNGMGYLQEMNERLVEEIDAVLDDYPVIHVRRTKDG